MRILIAAIGRARRLPEAELCVQYLRRIHAWKVDLREVEARGGAPDRRAAEGEALQAAVPKNAWVVALDRGGEVVDSPGFAHLLRNWQEQAVGPVAFLIGGADGLSPAMLTRARYRLSFGVMTWPHLLARVMLIEQIFRAQEIIAGNPYHRV